MIMTHLSIHKHSLLPVGSPHDHDTDVHTLAQPPHYGLPIWSWHICLYTGTASSLWAAHVTMTQLLHELTLASSSRVHVFLWVSCYMLDIQPAWWSYGNMYPPLYNSPMTQNPSGTCLPITSPFFLAPRTHLSFTIFFLAKVRYSWK